MKLAKIKALDSNALQTISVQYNDNDHDHCRLRIVTSWCDVISYHSTNASTLGQRATGNGNPMYNSTSPMADKISAEFSE